MGREGRKLKGGYEKSLGGLPFVRGKDLETLRHGGYLTLYKL
jgi:hypothetical protein